MSGVASPLSEVEDFAFQHSSPLSLRQPSTFSSPPTHAPDVFENGPSEQKTSRDTLSQTTHGLRPAPFHTRLSAVSDDRRSSHSSISSFPASVLHHELDGQRSPSSRLQNDFETLDKSSPSRRHRDLARAFRHPSSIREMQLNDETSDETDSVVSHRRSGSRTSVRSHGSGRTGASQRTNRSAFSSPKKSSGLKKEFPLVLLHCSLLPPTSNVSSPITDKDLFTAIIPEPYRARWTQLQNRLGSSELRARGVLLPHPEDDYELLEERLLEALELQQPRIKNSHFIDPTSIDSGFESGSQSGSDSGAHHQCPDCGCSLATERRWDIKVFAANGLMRAPAWSAVWKDMERVDIEVSMWMPEDVRQEVDTRMEALKAVEQEAELQATDPMKGENYATEQWAQEVTPPLVQKEATGPPAPATSDHHTTVPQVRYVQVSSNLPLLADRRNIAIIVLSLLVLVYASLHAQSQLGSQPTTAAAAKSSVTNNESIGDNQAWTSTALVSSVATASVSTVSVSTDSASPVQSPSDEAAHLPEDHSGTFERPPVTDTRDESFSTKVIRSVATDEATSHEHAGEGMELPVVVESGSNDIAEGGR
jgi:hypothetical protein